MKKYLLLLFISVGLQQTSFAQNIGINESGALPHPSAMLDVSASNKGVLIPRTSSASRNAIAGPAKGLILYDTTSSSFWYHNGNTWVELAAGSGTGTGSNFWSGNGTNIFNSNAGNMGIGTATPADKLTVNTFGYGLTHTDGNATIGTWIGNFQGITTVKIGTMTNNALNFFTNNSSPQMTLSTNGSLGIGTELPNAFSKLTVETAPNNYGIMHRTTDGNLLGTYFGGTSAGIGTFSNTNMRIFSNNISAIFISAGTNNVGIGVDYPANKLQVGSVGNTGFATNDFAIGNGTNAMAIYQTDASTLIGSTTDIMLKPGLNGQGGVGINSTKPRATLEVGNNFVQHNGYYSYMNGNAGFDGVQVCRSCDLQVSIMASYGVYAAEFDAFSDARIKNIIAVSDAAKDLETVNALRITNYTMKDKVRYGDKSFKKVIAQEVENVYPQAVSKHSDFIPNVYQASTNITRTGEGWLLRFANDHHISKGAKKLQGIISETGGMQSFDIISIPSDKTVVIKVADIKNDKVFVYGEEVDDFRTVDYEGLTTLNISATQEISKLLRIQSSTIQKQQKQIALLEKRLAALEQNKKIVLP